MIRPVSGESRLLLKFRWQKHSVWAAQCILILLIQQGFPEAHADVTTIGHCSTEYEQCLQAWKQRRIDFLKSETGYLNLSGLFWLEEGDNSFGSDAANDIVFPARADSTIGTFRLRGEKVLMLVDANVVVRFGGQVVTSMPLPEDTTKATAVVSHKSLRWTVIRRDNQFAIRVRDLEHPILSAFGPIDYYATDPDMRITATMHRYGKPRKINVGTVIEGLSYNPWSPGVVRFEIDGKSFELEAYDAAGELFFVFGDRTSGRETYPAGRFLYAEAPGADGKVLLDFNTAQNPPCAFNEFATCPVASPRNRMATRIKAGERFDAANH
jgi:hypothetical protein